MIRIQPGSILLVVTLALFSTHSLSEIYGWVDENGEVHYSDKALADKEKSTTISADSENKVQYTGRQKPSARPIMRLPDKIHPTMHLVGIRYIWKKNLLGGKPEKIGIYHVGKGCTTRGAITAPKVFTHHKELLPNEYTLPPLVVDIVEELGYDIRQTQNSILVKALKATGGIVLDAEITAMKLKTCAPRIYSEEHLNPAELIAPYKFRKNRVRLTIHWRLRDNSNQVILYETDTKGEFDGWKNPTGPGRAIRTAMQTAVKTLFARQDFIDRLFEIKVAERPKLELPKTKPLRLPSTVPEEKGILTSLKNMLLLDSMRTRAQVSRAMVEISALKVHVIQYYQIEGDWPEDLSALGISNSTFFASDTIDIVNFDSDGSIVARLKSSFGSNKFLMLQPQIDDINLVRWNCYSNLEQSELPGPCRAR